jgi:hypothetical protein
MSWYAVIIGRRRRSTVCNGGIEHDTSVKPFFDFFCWTENWTGFRGTGQRSCIMGDVPDAPSSLSQPAIVRRRRRPKSDMQKDTEIAGIEDFVRNRK